MQFIVFRSFKKVHKSIVPCIHVHLNNQKRRPHDCLSKNNSRRSVSLVDSSLLSVALFATRRCVRKAICTPKVDALELDQLAQGYGPQTRQNGVHNKLTHPPKYLTEFKNSQIIRTRNRCFFHCTFDGSITLTSLHFHFRFLHSECILISYILSSLFLPLVYRFHYALPSDFECEFDC